MGTCVGSDAVPGLVDPYCVRDIYVEGLGSWQRTAKGGHRFVLYVMHKVDGMGEFRAVVSLIYPPGVAETINTQVRSFLDGEPVLTDDVPEGVLLC